MTIQPIYFFMGIDGNLICSPFGCTRHTYESENEIERKKNKCFFRVAFPCNEPFLWSVLYPKWIYHSAKLHGGCRFIEPTFEIKAELTINTDECYCEDEDECQYEEPLFELAFCVEDNRYRLILDAVYGRGPDSQSNVDVTDMKIGDVATLEARTNDHVLSLKIKLVDYIYTHPSNLCDC
jgi:hypothetical protein